MIFFNFIFVLVSGSEYPQKPKDLYCPVLVNGEKNPVPRKIGRITGAFGKGKSD